MYVCAFVCVCMLRIQRLCKGLPDHFMIGAYVNFSEKLLSLFSFRSGAILGVYGPHIYRPSN